MNLWNQIPTTQANNPYDYRYLSPKEYYSKMDEFYMNNGLFEKEQLTGQYLQLWTENIKPVRNVTHRSVNFFTAKVLGGDVSQFKFTANTDLVKQAIDQILVWSNFATKKQSMTRFFALYGDLFLKANCNDEKSFFDIIDAKNVTSFKLDSRGYITEIRIDVEVLNDQNKKEIYTEYWSKDRNYYGIWQGNHTENTKLENLGTPIDGGSITADFGIDFPPFVHAVFNDKGKDRGANCIEHCLDKIIEANRQATELYAQLYRFNKAKFILSSEKDSFGRLDRVRINGVTQESSTEIDFDQNDILRVPAGADLKPLSNAINFDAGLKVLDSQMAEIEQDLPELRYYKLIDAGANISGKALKTMISGALDRAEEARGNILSALIRAVQMCLTLGVYYNLFPSTIGKYENGDFDFSVALPDMVPVTIDEQASTLKTLTDSKVPLGIAMKMCGFAQEEIDEAVAQQQVEKQQNQQLWANSFNNVGA